MVTYARGFRVLLAIGLISGALVLVLQVFAIEPRRRLLRARYQKLECWTDRHTELRFWCALCQHAVCRGRAHGAPVCCSQYRLKVYGYCNSTQCVQQCVRRSYELHTEPDGFTLLQSFPASEPWPYTSRSRWTCWQDLWYPRTAPSPDPPPPVWVGWYALWAVFMTFFVGAVLVSLCWFATLKCPSVMELQ